MKTAAIKYCAHCGALIEADSKFCAQCGSKLHETSAKQSRIQSERPPENGTRSTRTPLAVVGICILALLVGSLLFSLVQKSTSGYPSDMPPLAKFSVMGSERLKNCRSVVTYKIYQVNGVLDVWMAVYADKARNPFWISHTITNGFQNLANNHWIDLDGDGLIDEQYDTTRALDAKYHLTTKIEKPGPLSSERQMRDDRGICNMLYRMKR